MASIPHSAAALHTTPPERLLDAGRLNADTESAFHSSYKESQSKNTARTDVAPIDGQFGAGKLLLLTAMGYYHAGEVVNTRAARLLDIDDKDSKS